MSPTYEPSPTFTRDLGRLTSAQRKQFLLAVQDLIADLNRGQGFRKGLRVKRVQSTTGVFEMTWAPDGRATWQYGPEVVAGQPHVIWRRIGTHDIFRQP